MINDYKKYSKDYLFAPEENKYPTTKLQIFAEVCSAILFVLCFAGSIFILALLSL